jgi:hypothetical protein
MINWILKPFKKRIGWKGLLKRWFFFLLAGLVVMGGIQAFARYDLGEADTLVSESGEGCDALAMWLLLLLPPIEEGLFRILPYHFMGRNAAFAGSMIWGGLHLFGRNLAIVGFQLVMAIFYFKLVSSKRYKESIIFHECFNIIPLLTCFLI